MTSGHSLRTDWRRATAAVAAGALLCAGPFWSTAHAADPEPEQILAPADWDVRLFNGSAAASADGRLVAYVARSGGTTSLFLFDRTTGATSPLGIGEGLSPRKVSMSGDGSRIAFSVDEADLPGASDPGQVYVYDRAAGTTSLVSTSGVSQGNEGSWDPEISADGSVVAFTTRATNLVPGTAGESTDVVAKVLDTGEFERISGADPSGHSSQPAVSADGRFVAFATEENTGIGGGDNGTSDVLVRDRETGRLRLASSLVKNDATSPAISADGNVVAYAVYDYTARGSMVSLWGTWVTTLSDNRVERLDIDEAGKTLPSPVGGPSVSADGRFVLYNRQLDDDDYTTGLTAHRIDVYVRDLSLDRTRLVSSASVSPYQVFCSAQSLSADGRFALFVSFNTSGTDTSKLWLSDLGEAPRAGLVSLVPPSISVAPGSRASSYAFAVADAGSWEPGGWLTRSYQWLRDGLPINGATGETYVVGPEDFGSRIAVTESVTRVGMPSASATATSTELVAMKPRSRLTARTSHKRVRVGKPVVLNLRVDHDFGVRPQGRVIVRWGHRSRRVAVDADGRMRLRIKKLSRGRHTFVVSHRGTAFVEGASAVRVKVRAVR